MVKDSDHSSKYFPSNIWRVSIHQNFVLLKFRAILYSYLCLQSFTSGFETSLWLITWLQVVIIALVPSCIIFTQALWAQVIVYLMAHLIVMYSLKVVSWYALHPFTYFINTMWSFIRCAPGLCSRASVILDLIISPLICIVNFDFLLMTLWPTDES